MTVAVRATLAAASHGPRMSDQLGGSIDSEHTHNPGRDQELRFDPLSELFPPARWSSLTTQPTQLRRNSDKPSRFWRRSRHSRRERRLAPASHLLHEKATSTTHEEEQQLRRLVAPNTSLEEAWFLINAQARRHRAAASTVEALVYQLRRGGTGLSNLRARQRLSELSEQQLHEVSARLQKFMPHIARAWSPSEVELLVQLWSDLHG
jgi:hypothetical protein